MTNRRVAKFSLTVAILTLVVSVAGFIVTLVLNAFFLDKYDAYGEVAIPGSGGVHLPAGDVTVSLHTLVIGGTNGVGLPVPPLGISISPPDGVPQPEVTESIGSTTTVNNDATYGYGWSAFPSRPPTASRPTVRSADTSTPGWRTGTRVRMAGWCGFS